MRTTEQNCLRSYSKPSMPRVLETYLLKSRARAYNTYVYILPNLSEIRYAFVYYQVRCSFLYTGIPQLNTEWVFQKSKNCLYFSRDPLGRRSLLIRKRPVDEDRWWGFITFVDKPNLLNPYIILGSVSVGQNPGYSFEELSTEGIFCLDLGSLGKSLDVSWDDSKFWAVIFKPSLDTRRLWKLPNCNTALCNGS